MSRPRAATLAVFAIAAALCVGACVYDLDDYPPHFDYDSATLGIFVNNLTFNGRYDYGFNPSFSQNAYRINWAAQFLPVSVPLSWTQRTLHVPFDRVELAYRSPAERLRRPRRSRESESPVCRNGNGSLCIT